MRQKSKFPVEWKSFDGPIQARLAAREQLDYGADWLKVYMNDRWLVGKNGELVAQPTLTEEEPRAIVDEAHGWGKKVALPCLRRPGIAPCTGWRLRFDRTRVSS
jgi:imidazolonepropionase-like amidohydrolase